MAYLLVHLFTCIGKWGIFSSPAPAVYFSQIVGSSQLFYIFNPQQKCPARLAHGAIWYLPTSRIFHVFVQLSKALFVPGPTVFGVERLNDSVPGFVFGGVGSELFIRLQNAQVDSESVDKQLFFFHSEIRASAPHQARQFTS